MSPEENSKTRRIAFSEYITIMGNNGGKVTEEALEALTRAFDVKDTDILDQANMIANEKNLDAQLARFMLMMEDLRDYRDTAQIKSTRRDILGSSYNAEDLMENERYLFLG